jgi:hypothetical protein
MSIQRDERVTAHPASGVGRSLEHSSEKGKRPLVFLARKPALYSASWRPEKQALSDSEFSAGFRAGDAKSAAISAGLSILETLKGGEIAKSGHRGCFV